jgi:hypothetical protein
MSLDVGVAGGSSDPEKASVDLEVFEGLGGAERDDVFMKTERQIRGLQALQAAMIHRVERSGSFRDNGYLEVEDWLQAVTNSSASTSARQVLVARMLNGVAARRRPKP